MVKFSLTAAVFWILELVCKAMLIVAGVLLRYVYEKEFWGWLTIVSILTLAAIAVSMWINGRSRRSVEKAARKTATRKLLRAFGASFEHVGAQRVRANIMIYNKKRQTRVVDGDTAYNMKGDPDENLEIGAFAGVSGTAMHDKDVVLGDLSKEPLKGAPGFGLKKRELKKVRQKVRTIISGPIYNPDDRNGDLLGTIQVDSDAEFDLLIPDKIQATKIATAFGDAMSFVLKS
jgi:hypothetical protein